MRNYIILNGKSSTELKGLLIQNLPPISKPKIRTATEEIDGRDGDIITELGYSAYDKEFEIGLYDNFDMDEIIPYFNSKGKVIFSNEIDKYYNYQILDQIDYERLIRFKTAKVKMHVQPFKYSSVEGIVTFAGSSLSNNEITIKNNGNYISKPVVTITGTGTINLNINGYQVLVIDLSEENEVVIDTANMEAYNPTTQDLMNRKITGDYNNLYLNVGKNTISWSGTITKIEIDNYSRWL